MKINNILFENEFENNKLNLKRQFGDHNNLQLYDRKRRCILIVDENGYVEVNPNGKYDLIKLDAIRTVGNYTRYGKGNRNNYKDPNAPKKNKCAFLLFCDYIRDKAPGKSAAHKMQWIGQKWKSLDSINKSKFEEMAKKEKIQYLKKLHEYNNNRNKQIKNENNLIVKQEE